MTTCDDVLCDRPTLWHAIKPRMLRIVRMAAAILVGIAASS